MTTGAVGVRRTAATVKTVLEGTTIAELPVEIVSVVHDVGPYPLGEIIVRWTTVGDAIELHTVTIPIGVGASNDPDAPDPDADPAVTEQVTILRAAAERSAALEALDRGDFDTASNSLDRAAFLLANTKVEKSIIDELLRDAERARQRDWDASTSKKHHSQSRQHSKGRKARYDDSDPT